jgi:hypothetical protein
MSVSNLSSGIRPGVCTSESRPTAPYEGQTIYETDTDLVRVWSGSAWVEVSSMLTKAPRGILQFAQKTTNTGSVTTETVVVTMPAFTAVANRYYRIAGFCGSLYTSPAASGILTLRIRKGTSTAGELLQTADTSHTSAGGNGDNTHIVWVGTLTAGSQQLVLTASATSTSSFFGSNDYPLQFLIEDIGAA